MNMKRSSSECSSALLSGSYFRHVTNYFSFGRGRVVLDVSLLTNVWPLAGAIIETNATWEVELKVIGAGELHYWAKRWKINKLELVYSTALHNKLLLAIFQLEVVPTLNEAESWIKPKCNNEHETIF